jgi:hypothetical protein
MAQIKPEWAVCKEAEAIITKLCTMYPERLGHIDPTTFGCAVVTNKEKTEGQEDCRVKGMRLPEAIFSSKIYVVSFCLSTWEGYSPAQRSAMLMKTLLRVPDTEDGPDGSVMKEDLRDMKCLVKAFGVDYMANPELPDLCDKKQPLPLE